jgi:hypothetical protein
MVLSSLLPVVGLGLILSIGTLMKYKTPEEVTDMPMFKIYVQYGEDQGTKVEETLEAGSIMEADELARQKALEAMQYGAEAIHQTPEYLTPTPEYLRSKIPAQGAFVIGPRRMIYQTVGNVGLDKVKIKEGPDKPVLIVSFDDLEPFTILHADRMGNAHLRQFGTIADSKGIYR